MQHFSRRFIIWGSFISLVLGPILSQEAFGFQAAVDATLQPAFARITEPTVKASIAFLASDELAGRGTGTAEFDIAAAYVASRFEAAGLQGGAADGSFFHTKELLLERTPDSGIEFQDATGRLFPHRGMLAGAESAVMCESRATQVDLSDLDQLPDDTRLAVAEYASPSGRRGRGGAMAALSEAAVKLRAKGVQALILAIPPDDGLIAMAKQLSTSPRPASVRNKLAIPIILVDAARIDELLEQPQLKLVLPAQVQIRHLAKNVIGLLPGSDPELAQERLVFSAHLDHLGRIDNNQDDQIYNGADDDASGVTAVLTLADAYAALPDRPRRSTVFITFWGEESGLLGSKDFAENPPWPLESIVANVNIEMIGRPEPGANGKVWVTGWGKSDLGKGMNEAALSAGVEIFEHPQYSAMLYQASDNWSLAQKGVIAHSFSGGSLHQDYHQPSDEWEKLNLPHMTLVIRGLFAGSLPIAMGEFTPKKSQD